MLHVTIIVGNFFQFLKLHIFSHFKTKGKLLVCVYLLYLVIQEFFIQLPNCIFTIKYTFKNRKQITT